MQTITDHPAGSPAAESAAIDARIALRSTSDEGLLTTFAALTHRIHAHEAKHRAYPFADRLRTQRDLVQAEILRRMGGDR